jgi:RNA polymerase sigma-70 factor (ECF subfamily)
VERRSQSADGGDAVTQEREERETSGDIEAWLARYGAGLRRYFQRRVSAQEAEDLVQETFLALHARRGTAPIENVQGYLFAVASHLLAKRKPNFAFTVLDEAGALADGFSPEQLLISRQEMILVIAAIRKLPPRTRQAFILHRFEDMTYTAIGRKLDISVSAVSKLIARALAQITSEMGSKR